MSLAGTRARCARRLERRARVGSEREPAHDVQSFLVRALAMTVPTWLDFGIDVEACPLRRAKASLAGEHSVQFSPRRFERDRLGRGLTREDASAQLRRRRVRHSRLRSLSLSRRCREFRTQLRVPRSHRHFAPSSVGTSDLNSNS